VIDFVHATILDVYNKHVDVPRITTVVRLKEGIECSLPCDGGNNESEKPDEHCRITHVFPNHTYAKSQFLLFAFFCLTSNRPGKLTALSGHPHVTRTEILVGLSF
jgi:hypothetical protein